MAWENALIFYIYEKTVISEEIAKNLKLLGSLRRLRKFSFLFALKVIIHD